MTAPGTTLQPIDVLGDVIHEVENGFSAIQAHRCAELFEAFYQHPYLRGLADGIAPRKSVLHYVGQDNQYLTAFIRCYGLGISRSPDRETMDWFKDNIVFLLDDETHPHHVLCEAFGVRYEDAQTSTMAPTAQAYVDHLVAAAHDSLGVLLAALAPCPWTYIWAAQRQMAEAPVTADNPFYGWWEFYANRESTELLRGVVSRLDDLAAVASAEERNRMASAFEISCHYEVRFWQMAWTREIWEDTLRLAHADSSGVLGISR